MLLFIGLLVLIASGCSAEVKPSTSGSIANSNSPKVNNDSRMDTGAKDALHPDRLIEKTFDDIKFDIEPDEPFARSMLTPEIEALAGQRIRIRGYILPTARKRGIKDFVLVRDNQECCFGPGAALYDCILVKMHPPETAEFSIRPVAVEGRFEIKEFQGPDGRHLAIFRMEGDAVE